MALKEDLMERLAILEENQVVSEKVADFSGRVVELIFQKKLDASESVTMFITHLAMAGQRVLDGAEELPLENLLLDKVKQEAVYEQAERFLEEILEKTDIAFPDTEKDFLVLHLCNLLQKFPPACIQAVLAK